MLTFLDIRNDIAEFVEGGLSPSDDRVKDRANNIEERLLIRGDWYDTQRLVKIWVKNNTFALPYFVQRVIAANIGTSPAPTFDLGYEFEDHGPGEHGPLEPTYSGPALKDIGTSPCFFDIPPDMPGRLMAFSDAAEDLGKKLTVYAMRANKNQIFTGSTPGFELPILVWNGSPPSEGRINGDDVVAGNYSEEVQEIEAIRKPITQGYVCLYSVHPDIIADPTLLDDEDYAQHHPLWFLGKFHPDERRPTYRRYRVLDKTTRDATSILAWCKLRHVKMTRDDDPGLLRSRDAYVYEAMAMREERNRNTEAGRTFKAMALNELAAWHTDMRTEHRTVKFDESYSMGDRPSLD